MKQVSLYLLSGILLLGIVGCEPYEPVYTDDLDLVITNYTPDFDFKSKQTYSVPDSVVLISEEIFSGTPQFANPAYGNTIIASIKENMSAKGWTLVDKNQDPDVMVLPSVSQTTNFFYYYSYGYWNWYYPGGWGWYYPGYYYPPTVSSYKTGTLFLQLVDLSDTANVDNLPVVWSGIVNGLAQGGTASVNARIKSTINQAFKQSPILNQ
ncbi:MAG: DUF4136 domain-containing protein [Bacteroidia bacterium]|nr:DUF4136 domain-containing protein [Bacteroidia bacterium]